MPARDAGRRDAFAEFVAARSAALHRTAYLMVGEHALAQDLLQEALTKTYVAWPRLREVANAEAYTRKAITTTAISWRRKRSWHEQPHETLPDRAAHGDPIGDNDTRAWVWAALQQLPARQRAAVVLRYYEDLTEAQTAAAMGCAVGTVKSQVSTALKTLRTRLGSTSEPLPLDALVVTR
ncbi:SigE family RNA polymerase sigma factor [Nocardioides iriomotensis]|uniref:SigE family RNA polymerase sigma factor n=1 Tax=Nocardioides iriomotensis TaxID=715784 RepID=A0A4Q5J3N3_9ACTN|nr:SigE family RNA polymerase sigma factor [Nocardioides iriomotensis]RYU12005.1 SigE family RNA polymerase sigma factor [Nocardioides iriomotensis]